MPLNERKNESPLTLAELVHEVKTLNRRFLRYRVIGVIALAMFLLGGWALWSGHETNTETKKALHTAQQAIDAGLARDRRSAQDRQCTANYLNAQRSRQVRLESISGKRVTALDNEVHRLNQAVRDAVQHKSAAEIRRASHRLLVASHRYDLALVQYHRALKRNPIPPLKRYACATIASRRDRNHPLPAGPTVTKTVTAAAPQPTPSTVGVPVPGPTTTQYVTRKKVVIKYRVRTKTVTATPSCHLAVNGRCVVP